MALTKIVTFWMGSTHLNQDKGRSDSWGLVTCTSRTPLSVLIELELLASE